MDIFFLLIVFWRGSGPWSDLDFWKADVGKKKTERKKQLVEIFNMPRLRRGLGLTDGTTLPRLCKVNVWTLWAAAVLS